MFPVVIQIIFGNALLLRLSSTKSSSLVIIITLGNCLAALKISASVAVRKLGQKCVLPAHQIFAAAIHKF